MPKPTYARCRECGRHRDEVGILSRTRLCSECGAARFEANAVQISAGVGPFAAHRERRILMAAHRRLLAMQDGP